MVIVTNNYFVITFNVVKILYVFSDFDKGLMSYFLSSFRANSDF